MRLLLGLAALVMLAGHARAEELTKVTVGGIQLPSNAAIYIAMDRGYFAKQGLEVSPVWFTAAASVFSAVVSRDVDIGATGITAATFNLASKGGFKIIGGYTVEKPGFHLNGFLASNKAFDQGFTGFAQMAGKRIGITTAGSTHQYYVGLLAKKYGIDLKSVSLVPLESYANITAALQSGQVDGAILPPPTTERLVQSKGAHLLAWTGDEVQYQQGVIFASPQTIAAKHDVVARFMRAYAQAAAEYDRNLATLGPDGKLAKGPEYDALADIIARHAGIKPAELEGQITFIDPQARFHRDDILRQVAFWQDMGLVGKGFDFSRIFDDEFGQPAPK